MRARVRINGGFIIILLVALVGATPAAAHDTWSNDPPYSRTRSGVSRWAPQWASLTTSSVSATNGEFLWQFRWHDSNHMPEVNGWHRALEVKARVHQYFAVDVDGYGHNSFPSGSQPYIDTLFMDGSYKNFGYGAGNANYFDTSRDYWAVTGYKKGSGTLSYQITSDVVAATNEEHNGCGSSPQWCVFPDYTQRVVKANEFSAKNSESKTFATWTNYLSNQSFEQGTNYYGFPSGGLWAVYCGSGYGSPCHLQFNSGSPASVSVAQDVAVNVKAGDHYTVESAVRCAAPVPCTIRLGYWALGINSNEPRGFVQTSVPADGQWYICRSNYDHGASAGLSYAHNTLRWELYNDSAGWNVDVDYTTMFKYSVVNQNTQGDPVTNPEVGPHCTLFNKYNN